MQTAGTSNILLSAATALELQPILDRLADALVVKESGFRRYQIGDREVHILITGAGMLSTCFELQQHLLKSTHSYDLVLHLGVAGSYDHSLALGTVLEVTSEIIGDLGIEARNGDLLPLHEQPWYREQFPFEQGVLRQPKRHFPDLPAARGRTLNRVTGSASTIEKLPPLEGTLESMEGAAVFYTCLRMKQPFACLRAVSNYVEPRDRANWRMQEAVQALADVFVEWAGI